MKPSEFLRTGGPRLDDAAIRATERELGVRLPAYYVTLLKEVNGGSFEWDATITVNRMTLHIQGICGIEKGHVNDLVSTVAALSDRVAPGEYLPFAFTYAGDHFFVELATGKVLWWRHEYNSLYPVAASMESFFDKVGYVDPTTIFENFCKEGTFSYYELFGELFPGKEKEVCQECARQGNLAMLRGCLEAGMPVGHSLRFAAMNGREEVLDYLLGLGMLLNEVDEKGRTILDWVEWNPEYAEMVRRKGGKTGEELR